ncbi:MAG: hypothetical protein ILO68_04545, partial [Clostridia bacterium]|nr:hypothetical protein [Clostridia bacterium]
MLEHLIPTPKQITPARGRCVLGKEWKIALNGGSDPRLFKAAVRLAEDVFEQTRARPAVTRILGVPALDGCVNVVSGEGDGEGYKLTVCPDSVTVRGESAAGTFYGIQTLRQ